MNADPKEAARRIVEWDEMKGGPARVPIEDAATVARALLAGEGNSVAAGAAPLTAGQPDYTAMNGPELLRALRDDASKWAAAFCQHAKKLGHGDNDEGWMIGWFANAIESSHDLRMRRTLERPSGNTSGEKAGLTQASDSLARPSSSPSPAVRDVTLREALEELANAAEGDLKSNQALDEKDEPGGWWSTRTENAIREARKLLSHPSLPPKDESARK